MKNELSKFERVADGAYFVIDIRAFESTITPYDPVLANQTIVTNEEADPRYVVDIEDSDPDLLNT